MSNGLKILISAYACEPNKGSEPGVGWNMAKQIAKYFEVWVITRTNNREVIERELKRNPVSDLHFEYFDLPRWTKFWKKGEKGIHLYYYLWQIGIYFVAKKLHAKVNFDIVHHITFVNNWFPSFLALLPITFVWGPVGSNGNIPRSFISESGFRARIDKILRTLAHIWGYLLDPFVRLTVKRASVILAINHEAVNRIPNRYRSKVRVMTAIGLSSDELAKISASPVVKRNSIRVLTVGRLIPLKGFNLAIKAFSRFTKQCSNARFIVIGEGLEKQHFINIATKYNIRDKVDFLGWLSREEVLKYMLSSDIFLFPSFEGGGMVVLEAMAGGIPIVCLDFGGPGEMVVETCGIKIKPLNPKQTIKEIADSILRLAKDPDLRKEMGKAGRKRIADLYSWDKKGEFIKNIYDRVSKKENSSKSAFLSL